MSDYDLKIVLDNGKYTYVRLPDGTQYAERHGERWRELAGDNLIYMMAEKIWEMEEALQKTSKELEVMLEEKVRLSLFQDPEEKQRLRTIEVKLGRIEKICKNIQVRQ